MYVLASIFTEPVEAVQAAQEVFAKGPETAVAAFFVVAFFFALYLLIRTKDAHRAELKELQLGHAAEVASIQKAHAESLADVQDSHAKALSKLNAEERERAVKLAVTMSSFLDMMDDVRFIAFEMRRVKEQRERKREQASKEQTDGNEG